MVCFRYYYDPSHPINENDYVLLMDHIKRCFVIKVERNKFVKICKDKFKIDILIGLNYGTIFTKVDNQWIKVDNNNDEYRSYWDLLETDYQGHEHTDSAPSKDNRNVVDDSKSQKLTADDINKMKKDNFSTSELITAIVQNSETFQSRTSMSKEKYIRRKEFRHLKLFEVRYCNLMSICESYFAGFPHKLGYMRFESLAMMLHVANVQFAAHTIIFDHSLGLITGAVAQRLQGTGKIFRLVTKGVSDKIVHELGINYYENIFSVDYDHVMKYCNDSELNKNDDSNCLKIGVAGPKHSLSLNNDLPTEFHQDLDIDSCIDSDVCGRSEVNDIESNFSQSFISASSNHSVDDDDLDHFSKKRKKYSFPGIYPLSNATGSDLEGVDVVIGNVSFNKCGKNNSLVNQYTFGLMKIANRFLKNDGRLIIFGQHFQPMSECYAMMTSSNQYVNVRLDETFMREYQIKPMCTHPLIARCRPCCGFILSAIKISSSSPL